MAETTSTSPRRREGRLAGRDQEGLPQARAQVPPGQEPGRQGGGGAVQGGPGRLRRPLRPGEARAVRPFGPRAVRGRGRGRRAGGVRLRGRRRRSRRPVRRPLRRRAAAAARRSAARPPRRATSRSTVQPLVRGLAAGRRRSRIPVELEAACATCRGTGAEPGTAPVVCPQCRGRGVVAREPGPVRALPAVPALPRQRHGRSRSRARHVPRHRPRAADEALQGEDPSRASRTARASGSTARARPGTAAARRATSTSSRGSRRRRSSSAAAPTS